MRFKASNENLTIRLTPDELIGAVRSAAAFLVPRFTKKLYLLAEPADLLDSPPAAVSVVAPGQEPSNFLASFRLLVRPGELIIVSSRDMTFTSEQWRELGERIWELQPN